MYFDDEINFLNNSSENIERISLTENEIEEIRNSYPNVSEDFINYLSEIGYGDILDSLFKVYSGLCDLEDLGLEDVYEAPNIVFFGDNYNGDMSGFDLSEKNDQVVELWHESGDLYYTGKTFRQYIRDLIGMPLS